jgi:hypothetical protein
MLPKHSLGPIAVVTLGGFGLYTLAGDAVAQARDPLTDQHDTFQLGTAEAPLGKGINFGPKRNSVPLLLSGRLFPEWDIVGLWPRGRRL